MKNLIKLSTLIVVIVFALNSTANAQLRYFSKDAAPYLTFGNTEPHRYFQLTFETFGIYLKAYQNKYMQFDLAAANPRIAGTGGQVVFYSSDTNLFNSIQVKNVYNYSDTRAKSNIKNIRNSFNSLNIISRLRPVTYSFIGESGESQYKRSVGATNQEMGLLAQEVEAVLPDVVLTDPEGKKLINYTAMIPLLLDAVQELKKEVDALKKEKAVINKELTEKIQAIKDAIKK